MEENTGKEGVMEKSILLVDDQALIRLPIAILLERAGYVVTEASSGVKALKKAAEKVFSLVITDLNMPEMDGLKLVKRLRSMPSYKDVPIIMHSDESRKTWIRAGMDAGVSHWVEKTSPAEMSAMVWKFIGYPVDQEDIADNEGCCLIGTAKGLARR